MYSKLIVLGGLISLFGSCSLDTPVLKDDSKGDKSIALRSGSTEVVVNGDDYSVEYVDSLDLYELTLTANHTFTETGSSTGTQLSSGVKITINCYCDNSSESGCDEQVTLETGGGFKYTCVNDCTSGCWLEITWGVANADKSLLGGVIESDR